MIIPAIIIGLFLIHGVTHNKPCSNEEFAKKIQEQTNEDRRSR